MINWKIRFKNKAFWLGLVPLILLLIQQVTDGLFPAKSLEEFVSVAMSTYLFIFDLSPQNCHL